MPPGIEASLDGEKLIRLTFTSVFRRMGRVADRRAKLAEDRLRSAPTSRRVYGGRFACHSEPAIAPRAGS